MGAMLVVVLAAAVQETSANAEAGYLLEFVFSLRNADGSRTRLTADSPELPIIVWVTRPPEGHQPLAELERTPMPQPVIPIGGKPVRPQFFPIVVPGTIRVESRQKEGVLSPKMFGLKNRNGIGAMLLGPGDSASARITEPEPLPLKIFGLEAAATYHYVLPLDHSLVSVFGGAERARLYLPATGNWQIRAWSEKRLWLGRWSRLLHPRPKDRVSKTRFEIEVGEKHRRIDIVIDPTKRPDSKLEQPQQRECPSPAYHCHRSALRGTRLGECRRSLRAARRRCRRR